MERSINWTPTGYTTHLPWGLKHFEAKKVDNTYWFFKSHIRSLRQYMEISINWTPTGYATNLPLGDKTF